MVASCLILGLMTWKTIPPGVYRRGRDIDSLLPKHPNLVNFGGCRLFFPPVASGRIIRQNERMNADDSDHNAPIFTDAYYEKRSFTGIARRKTEVQEIEFFQCRFEGCQFLESVFRRCSFEQCTFEKCDLSIIRPLESRFIGVRFLKSKLLGVDWTLAARPATLAFRGCNVNHSTFQRLALPKLELAECTAREVDFTGANLTKADFTRTDLLGSRFVETNLTGADFSHATGYAIDPTANRLKKAIFTLPEALSLLSAFNIVLK